MHVVGGIRRAPSGDSLRVIVGSGAEVVLAVAAASGAVAGLGAVTTPDRLGILYLLAVLAVAIRRGQLAALTTAMLSVLALNYFYIAPRHHLAIAHSQDVVELVVLLIAAIVVSRLAALSRERAAEADRRALAARAREREAQLLAESASAILAGHGLQTQLEVIGNRIARATGAERARISLQAVPSPAFDELAFALPGGAGGAWLYLGRHMGWDREQVERMADPLGRLVAVAVEREQVAERAAETEATRRADVAKTAVLHAISHDLRSPLTAIATAGSALRTAGLSEPERAELVEVVEEESARLARLVDDLLDLSRIESGAAEPRADWCDLHDVVGSALAHVGAYERIELALPADLPLVHADATQLERVFSNLIDNALKFSGASPVRISGGHASGRVTVRVTDFGPVIPRDDRARVFEPFFRGRAGRGAGSGLGLAICRGFVQANGGQIVLQSEAERGNSFAVTLPAAQPAAAASTVSLAGGTRVSGPASPP